MISYCTFSETNIHKKQIHYLMIVECVNDSFSFKKRVRLTHSFNRTGRGVFGALVGLSVFNTVGFGVFGALVGLSVFNGVGFGVLGALVGLSVLTGVGFFVFGGVVGRGVRGGAVGFNVFNLVGFGVLAAFVGFGVFGTFSFVGFGVFNVVGRGVFGVFSRGLRELTTASKLIFLLISDRICASSMTAVMPFGSNLAATSACLQRICPTPFGGDGFNLTSSFTSRSNKILHSKKLFGYGYLPSDCNCLNVRSVNNVPLKILSDFISISESSAKLTRASAINHIPIELPKSE